MGSTETSVQGGAIFGVVGIVLLGGIYVVASVSNSHNSSSDSGACIAVTSTAITDAIRVVPLAGVRSNQTLLTGATAYYVGAASGAVWVTNIDPSQESGALVLPLNALARAASDTGADVSPSAPILRNVSASSRDAQRAVNCAVTGQP